MFTLKCNNLTTWPVFFQSNQDLSKSTFSILAGQRKKHYQKSMSNKKAADGVRDRRLNSKDMKNALSPRNLNQMQATSHQQRAFNRQTSNLSNSVPLPPITKNEDGLDPVPSLVTYSILFCFFSGFLQSWISVQNVFSHCLRQLFLTVFWDLRA